MCVTESLPVYSLLQDCSVLPAAGKALEKSQNVGECGPGCRAQTRFDWRASDMSLSPLGLTWLLIRRGQ